MYCCTVDLLTRKLPTPKNIRYPSARKKLLKLMAEDQADRKSGKFLVNPSEPDMAVVEGLVKRDNYRADVMAKLLLEIKMPSAINIGLDGSRAVWLIALHNISRDIQQSVLSKMQELYYKDKTQVFYPGIPYLEDRVMINSADSLKTAMQLYGTQGYQDRETGQLKAFPIVDPDNLAERRMEFGLSPSSASRCIHSGTEK